MQLKLVVVAGETRQQELLLDLPAIIGRSKDAEVSLGHPLVSRRHCQLTWGQDGGLVVEDLGSLNGTYVGKTRIATPVCLEPGGLLTVGEVTFQAMFGNQTEQTGENLTVAVPADDVSAALQEVSDDRRASQPAVSGRDEELQDFLQSL